MTEPHAAAKRLCLACPNARAGKARRESPGDRKAALPLRNVTCGTGTRKRAGPWPVKGEHPLRFLLPWAIGFVFLTFLPLLATAALSFTRVELETTGRRITWVGAENYRHALRIDRRGAALPPHDEAADDPWLWRLLGGRPDDPRFYTALYNSLFYSAFVVPLGLCTSLAVAMLLSRPFRGAAVFRALVYLPHVLGGVATIVIWSWLFNPQFGWINQAIRGVYAILDPVVGLFRDAGTSDWALPDWLYSPGACKPAVIIMSIWTMGGSMLIFLAALRRVSPRLYEAASLDGAASWHRFRSITVPQISPAILFNATLGLVFSMQAFNEAYLLQTRRQDDGLLFYALYLYQVAFDAPYRFGYASALAMILFAVLFLLVGLLLWSARRWVHYA